jgi:hypothetical protein
MPDPNIKPPQNNPRPELVPDTSLLDLISHPKWQLMPGMRVTVKPHTSTGYGSKQAYRILDPVIQGVTPNELGLVFDPAGFYYEPAMQRDLIERFVPRDLIPDLTDPTTQGLLWSILIKACAQAPCTASAQPVLTYKGQVTMVIMVITGQFVRQSQAEHFESIAHALLWTWNIIPQSNTKSNTKLSTKLDDPSYPEPDPVA